MKKAFLLLLCTVILAVALVFPSCGGKGLYSEGNGKIKIVATTFAPFDLARQVAKGNASFTVLQTSGADLHNYAPTAEALKALTEADIFICVGGISDEAWLEKTLLSADNPELTVIKMVNFAEPLVTELEGHTHSDYCEAHHTHKHDEHHHGDGHDHEGDEHVWTSLKVAMKVTEAIALACAEKDPENSESYLNNAKAYGNELAELDSQYAEAVNASETKTLVFADRFPFIYLTSDYGICHYSAFSGCSSESESSFATFVRLSEAIEASKSGYVLITENGDTGLPDALGEQTGCKTLRLHSMQSVSRGEIEDGATYLEIMKSNLKTLKTALGCE